MKKTPWKKILSSALTCFVIALAVFLVFRGNYQEILENLSKAPLWGTAVLFALAAAYQAAEAGICMALVRARLPGFSYRDAVGVTFLGVFGNVATCAVGSIPMQSYRLHQCGLTIGHGIGMMTMEYVFHKASIVLYATVMLIWQGGWLREACPDLSKYLVAGYGVCIVIITALVLVSTWGKMKALALRLLWSLPETEAWERRKSAWAANLESLYAESRNVLKSRGICRRVLLLNAMKLFCLYSAVYFSLRFLGIPALPMGRVQLLAALMLMISSALPNIAGVGPAEFTFLLLFTPFMTAAQASSALILYRTATYFFPFLLSIAVIAAGGGVLRLPPDTASPPHGERH